MSVASGNTSGFMGNLRTSYARGGFSLAGHRPTSQPTAEPVVSATTPVAIPAMTQDDQLAVAEAVIDQVAPVQKSTSTPDALGSLAQAMPRTLTSVIPDPLNPASPTPAGQVRKEVYQVGATVIEAPATPAEYPAGIQDAEQEKLPEISPEVESFLQRAEQQPDQLPQEIVIADNQEISSLAHHPKQPVVVLPITAQGLAQGQKKSEQFSFRWLVEWSLKMMKKFTGQVIYREGSWTALLTHF